MNFPNFTMHLCLPDRTLSHRRHPVTRTWVTMQLNLSAKCQVSPLKPGSSSTPGDLHLVWLCTSYNPSSTAFAQDCAHDFLWICSISLKRLKSFKLLRREVSMGVEEGDQKKRIIKVISEMPLTQMQILSKMCLDENWSSCECPFEVLGLCIRQRYTRQ